MVLARILGTSWQHSHSARPSSQWLTDGEMLSSSEPHPCPQERLPLIAWRVGGSLQED
jgi:hypothetical protein